MTYQWKQIAYKGLLPSISGHSMVSNGQMLLIFGGKDSNNILSNSVYAVSNKYEVALLKTNGDIPAPRTSQACAINNIYYSHFYMFGGASDKDLYNDLFSFNLETNTWEMMPFVGDPPAKRYGHSLNYYKDSIYVFGGTNETKFYNDLHKYDLLYKKWSKIEINAGNAPKGRYKHQSVITDDGELFVIGGTGAEKYIDINKFDISRKIWSHVIVDTPTYLKGLYGHTAHYNRGKIIIFGV